MSVQRKLEAIAPAIVGLGRYQNSMGTTQKQTALRLPHHSVANQAAPFCMASDVLYRHDLESSQSARRLKFCGVTLFLAY